MEEIWKPVKFKGVDYSGKYEVSNKGRLKRIYKNSFRLLKMSQTSNKKYLGFDLFKNGKRKHGVISNIVYESFIGPIKNGYVIDHIDSNSMNNHLSNLQMITKRMNCSKEKQLNLVFQLV